MALNGINLPLAFTGQEAIFQRVGHCLSLVDAGFSVLFFVSLILSLMMVNNDDADENLLTSLCIIF